jgi:hypothetical protein
MVQLSDAKRTEYEQHSPVYWRKATDGNELQAVFFKKLLYNADWIALVHDGGNGVDGYVIGHIVESPPVYDMGGKACLIHDFVVERPELWSSIGERLLDAIEQEGTLQKAVVLVVVCGAHDEVKRTFLLKAGTHVTSEWHVRSIAPVSS